ncbi:MAG TPA: YrdB family protein [Puia sp.]|jgi:hypothetical protein
MKKTSLLIFLTYSVLSVTAQSKPSLLTAPANLVLRFLLELVMLAVIAYWGYHHFPGWQGIVAAIAFPLLAAICWGVFRTPNDPRPAPMLRNRPYKGFVK